MPVGRLGSFVTDPGTLLRRGLHLASPALLVYYLLPDDLGAGIGRVELAVALWVVALGVEGVRLATGARIVGIRDYERRQISAYFWGGTGLLLAVLLFPPPLVVAATFGMAWVDPLCALTRRYGGYPYVPLLVYAALAVGTLRILMPWSLQAAVLLAVVGAAVCVGAEYPSLPQVDDDFTTLVAPLVAMTVLAVLL